MYITAKEVQEIRVLVNEVKKAHGYENLIDYLGDDLGHKIHELIEKVDYTI